MKRFAFRLARLLDLRQAEEKERARALGVALREEESRRAEVEASDARLADARAQYATTPRELSQAGTLRNLELTIAALAAENAHLATMHEEALARLAAGRDAFEQARIARRVLERLREQRRDAWGTELSRYEQALSDEAALQRSQPDREDA